TLVAREGADILTVGADALEATDDVTIKGETVEAGVAGLTGKFLVSEGLGFSIETQTQADLAIKTIQGATNVVSSQRAALGAIQNRLEHTINNLGASSENLTAAESRIRDV